MVNLKILDDTLYPIAWKVIRPYHTVHAVFMMRFVALYGHDRTERFLNYES